MLSTIIVIVDHFGLVDFLGVVLPHGVVHYLGYLHYHGDLQHLDFVDHFVVFDPVGVLHHQRLSTIIVSSCPVVMSTTLVTITSTTVLASTM